ncbi:MAG: YceI family protein [Alphaproteobacteria bacterium]
MTRFSFHRLAVAALLLAAFSSPAEAAAQKYTVDAMRSKIVFAATQDDTRFFGGFNDFKLSIVFSPDDLEHSQIVAIIDTGSAFAGSKERDDALPGKDWFNVGQFPEATFATKRITQTGPDQYLAHATLTIRGIARDIDLPFSLAEQNGITQAKGSIMLNRADFGVGQGPWAGDSTVKFDVRVDIEIYAVKKG